MVSKNFQFFGIFILPFQGRMFNFDLGLIGANADSVAWITWSVHWSIDVVERLWMLLES